MSDNKNLYKGRARRMVARWAGKRIEANRKHSSFEINHQRSVSLPFIDPDSIWQTMPARLTNHGKAAIRIDFSET